MTASFVLEAKDIYKSFPELEILKGISLQIGPGETVAIMGKSGEGKSTLLNIFGTLDLPSRGEVRICGSIPSSASFAALRNKYIGFIFQSYHLLEDFSVLENILIPLKIGRTFDKTSKARALFLIEAVGLKGKENTLAKLLSGGEKQRVAIARALVCEPKLLLADEPTGNLDQGLSREIQALLLSLARKSHTALIVVTHDADFASACDRIFYLKEGLLWPQ